MTEKEYNVRFERTLHEKTTIEGTLSLRHDDDSAEDLMDRIDEELEGEEAEVTEVEENGEEDVKEGLDIEYTQLRYQEITIRGEAPVVAESADDAGEKFLEQIRSNPVRGKRVPGEVDDDFEILEVGESS